MSTTIARNPHAAPREAPRGPRAMSPAGTMTKRERGECGAPGPGGGTGSPLAFWLHNFATENSAKGLADETLRLARTFRLGFPQAASRAPSASPRCGGSPTPRRRKRPSRTRSRNAPVGSADDPGAPCPAVDPREGRARRAARGAPAHPAPRSAPDVPIIWTLFAPPMILPMLARGGARAGPGLPARPRRGRPRAPFDGDGGDPRGVTRACAWPRGADGLFYATNVATRALMTPGGVPALAAPVGPAHPEGGRGSPVQSAPRLRSRHPARGVRGLPGHRLLVRDGARQTRPSPRRGARAPAARVVGRAARQARDRGQ